MNVENVIVEIDGVRINLGDLFGQELQRIVELSGGSIQDKLEALEMCVYSTSLRLQHLAPGAGVSPAAPEAGSVT